MIVLFPEFDCFRICRNITMHRPSCIDLAMLVCHGQWLPGSAERLLLNNPALAWRRSPTIKTTAANHVVAYMVTKMVVPHEIKATLVATAY